MHFKVPHLKLDIADPSEFLRLMDNWREAGSEVDIDALPAGVTLMQPAR